MKIPVIINNRNLLTWPKAMVERIKNYNDVGDIIIVDNGSTYEPLLEWYETKPCIIRKIQNMGHAAPWDSGIVTSLKTEYYVVSDPDMGLDDTPNDTLLYLKNKIGNMGKIGLGLNWEIVNPNSIYYSWMQTHERNRWKSSGIIDDVYINVPVDTTFALYKQQNYFIGGGSVTYPYVARHIPWEMSKEDCKNNQEFSFYLKEANNSCSFKRFLT